MTRFDSLQIKDLVERARHPLTSDSMGDEVASALQQTDLTDHDRGQLLLAQLVMHQGTMGKTESVAQAAEVIKLLPETGALDPLVSAHAIAASIAASTGEFGTCLDHCLDIAGLMRSNVGDPGYDRAAANFGTVLIVVGAYNLATPVFANSLAAYRSRGETTGVLVCAANLTMTLSRRALVNGTDVLSDSESLRHLALVDTALLGILQDELAPEMRTVIDAVLTQSAQLRGDMDSAERLWGEMDAFTALSSESYRQFLCLVEAPLALRRGDYERAHRLVENVLDDLATAEMVPRGRVDALKIRSAIHEQTGDLQAALRDARAATELVLAETSGADLLIAQVDKRATLEVGQKELLDHTTYLSEQAMVDELSKIGNRRAYEVTINELATGHPHDLAVVLCDIDCFKQVNDQHGHTFGDDVIERVGAIVAAASGGPDSVFRYGGDEFVLLPGRLSLDQAIELAQDVRRAFNDEPWNVDGASVSITCSFGVWVGASTEIVQGIAEADRQMYQAKLAGRNTVRAASTLPPEQHS